MTQQALSRDDLGRLNYLHGVLTQPLDSWEGFYRPQSENMNFALRFQLGFSAYAVAALGLRTPAYHAPYTAALRAAVERMLDVRAWGYWRIPTGQGEQAEGSGHVAMMLSPRKSATATLPPPGDPVVQDNVQFSGHLSTMIGLYERASGEHRFDEPFELCDPQSGVSYSYTHSKVASRIHEQMKSNYFHGVACEPSCAYVPCNNHAMSSNTIHDAVHGTSFAEANKDWIEWVRRKLVLKGSAVRGLFGACFLRDVGIGAPVAFQFTDSWGLAFLQPFDRTLARKLYRIFRKRISKEGADAYVGSASICEKMEISDRALNTAFGLIAARGLGDEEMAQALSRYAEQHFDPQWRGSALSYAGATRTLHTTALLALGSVADNATLTRLFRERPTNYANTPELLQVTTPDGKPAQNVGAGRAEITGHGLEIGLVTLDGQETPLVLDVRHAGVIKVVLVDGTPWEEWHREDSSGVTHINVPPGGREVSVLAG